MSVDATGHPRPHAWDALRWGAARATPLLGRFAAAALLLTLTAPLAALALTTTPEAVQAGLRSAAFLPALSLSLSTSMLSLAVTVLLGTPLAWWLATTPSRWRAVAALCVELPIVIPPAVVGVALLQTLGVRGLLGPLLQRWDVHVPFSTSAVVVAQVIVSAPFFVQASAAAFREVNGELFVVARTLGASAPEAFLRVALPLALPGLLAGASLAWARALGEFGATLLFAGNRPGVTQTLPLAIFTALESDLDVAVALSLALTLLGGVLLLALRAAPRLWQRQGELAGR